MLGALLFDTKAALTFTAAMPDATLTLSSLVPFGTYVR
jgi:hypothetical protein